VDDEVDVASAKLDNISNDTLFFPYDHCVSGRHSFPFSSFFCGVMVLQMIRVKLMVPETKGVPLEQIQNRLMGRAATNPVSAEAAVATEGRQA